MQTQSWRPRTARRAEPSQPSPGVPPVLCSEWVQVVSIQLQCLGCWFVVRIISSEKFKVNCSLSCTKAREGTRGVTQQVKCARIVEVRMPMVSTGTGAIDVMSKLLQDRILMLNGQAIPMSEMPQFLPLYVRCCAWLGG